MLRTEMTTERFKNNTNPINIQKCVTYTEEVDGLNAASILFQSPCNRFIEDCEASEIIKRHSFNVILVDFVPHIVPT